jgi:hypothetical protein
LTGIVTLGGTLNDPLLLLKDTIAALSAALFNEAVHVLDALLPSELGTQDSEVSCAGALPLTVKD